MKNKISQKIINILTDNNFPNSVFEVVYLFIQIRKLIETETPIPLSKDNQLKFYADWLVHSNLDQKTTSNLLKNIREQYVKTRLFSSTKSGFNLFLFGSLVSDFSDLSNYLKVDNPLNDEHKWKAIVSFMLDELINCPLLLKDKYTKEIKSSFEFTKKKVNSYCYVYMCDETPTQGEVLINLT